MKLSLVEMKLALSWIRMCNVKYSCNFIFNFDFDVKKEIEIV